MSIYQTTYMLPENYSVDFALNQDFTSQVNGSKIEYYQDVIRRVDTNAILYDSTKTAISPALYNEETLTKTLTGGTISFYGFVKWVRTIWDSSGDSATSREVGFYSYTTATATLTIASPVADKQVDLTTIYVQAESVPIQSYIYYLYDSTGTTILDQSSVIYSEKLQHSFDGLIDNTDYNARCIITTKYFQEVDTGLVSFSVDYAQPNINITPTATVDEDTSSIEIGIGEVVQNIGSSTGTISYISDFLTLGNVGLQLADSVSTAYWSVTIPEDFTATFNWVADGFASGAIIKFENVSGNYIEVGHDGTNFYIDVDETVTNGIALALNSTVYVFGIRNQELVIQQSNVTLDTIKPWWKDGV